MKADNEKIKDLVNECAKNNGRIRNKELREKAKEIIDKTRKAFVSVWLPKMNEAERINMVEELQKVTSDNIDSLSKDQKEIVLSLARLSLMEVLYRAEVEK